MRRRRIKRGGEVLKGWRVFPCPQCGRPERYDGSMNPGLCSICLTHRGSLDYEKFLEAYYVRIGKPCPSCGRDWWRVRYQKSPRGYKGEPKEAPKVCDCGLECELKCVNGRYLYVFNELQESG